METATLLKRCRKGDELAWEALVRKHQGRVYGIAMTYVGDPDEARDVSQDIFVRVYRRLESCREDDRFLAWLIRLSRNACLDHLRRRRARPPARDIPAEEAVGLTDGSPRPDQLLEADSKKALVHRALQTLSSINREIIMLKDMQGMALEEISEMLEIPLGTAKSRSNRARIELARAVIELGGGPGMEATS